MRARNIAPERRRKALCNEINKRNKRLFPTMSDFNGQGISNGRGVTVARQCQQRFATAYGCGGVRPAIAPDVGLLQGQVLPLPHRS